MSGPRLLMVLAVALVLLLLGSCVARDVADTARAMRKQQCRDVSRALLGDVEVAQGREAQGRADVHGVKAASVDARAA